MPNAKDEDVKGFAVERSIPVHTLPEEFPHPHCGKKSHGIIEHEYPPAQPKDK